MYNLYCWKRGINAAHEIYAEAISTAKELDNAIFEKEKTFDLIILDCNLPEHGIAGRYFADMKL